MTARAGAGPRRLAGPIRIAFYWTIKTVAWPLTRIWVRLRVSGTGKIPRTGPGIVVANHTSFADATVLGSACTRRLTFLITKPVYLVWPMRYFYYMMGAVPVAPDVSDPGALKAALKTLHRGDMIGIFPEGQRMPNGSLGEGKAGVASLAARSGAPVIPAAIIGAHRAMPIGTFIPRPYPIRVVFGEPFTFPASNGARPGRESLDRFADEVMRRIRDLMPGEHEAGAGEEPANPATKA